MRHITTLAILLSLYIAPTVHAADGIDVMTLNQYLGAPLGPITSAETPLEFNQAVLAAIEQIADNRFEVRAGLLAKLIADRQPHLVGLQEVFTFRCINLPTQTGPGCDDPAYLGAFNDHLSLTMDALDGLGASYVPTASVTHLNIDIPADTNYDGAFDILISVTDHDVILARGDIAAGTTAVPYSSFCARPSPDGGPGCNYSVVAVAETVGGKIVRERGWIGVDTTVAHNDYRFVNSHLEGRYPDPTNPLAPFIQSAQAAELIAVVKATTPPGRSLVIVGDLNTSNEDPFIPGPLPLPPPFNDGIPTPYSQLVEAGFIDVWTLRAGNLPGYTCCQLDDLSNHQDESDQRIDLIFSFDLPYKVKKARVLGTDVSDKSSPFGLWPSDHGGVAATLMIQGASLGASPPLATPTAAAAY